MDYSQVRQNTNIKKGIVSVYSDKMYHLQSLFKRMKDYWNVSPFSNKIYVKQITEKLQLILRVKPLLI